MKAQKNTKIMVTCALLVALQVILARFLSIRFTETICMVAAQILLIPVLLSLSRQLTRRGAFPA